MKQRNDIRKRGLQYQVTDLPIHFMHKSQTCARQGIETYTSEEFQKEHPELFKYLIDQGIINYDGTVPN